MKMFNMKKDKRAVSPVIATILMVAITVVLAAVLYVMVMGFGGDSASAPTGSFTVADKQATTQYTLDFGAFSPSPDFSDCKIAVNAVTASQVLSGDMSANSTLDGSAYSAGDITYRVYDLADDDKISNGDYLLLDNLATGNCEISLVYVPTGDVIASKTFVVS